LSGPSPLETPSDERLTFALANAESQHAGTLDIRDYKLQSSGRFVEVETDDGHSIAIRCRVPTILNPSAWWSARLASFS
jgi:hypothetical protein